MLDAVIVDNVANYDVSKVLYYSLTFGGKLLTTGRHKDDVRFVSDNNIIIMKDDIGSFNKSIDNIKRNETCWSDTNPSNNWGLKQIDKLVCNNCGGKVFEILSGDFETLGKCINCNKYYLVHCG
jgi:hypothetical protein